MQETQGMGFQSLGWEDSPGGGSGTSLQYSCLGNPMDKGAWWAIELEVAKSRTQLSNWALFIIKLCLCQKALYCYLTY